MRPPFEFPAETAELTYKGFTYKFRELTVAENDMCREMATGPDDTFDGRVMIRAMIVTSAVEPEMAMDDLERLPARFYARLIDLVNALNDPATFQDDPGNS